MPGRVWEKAVDFAVEQNGFITFDDLRRLDEDPTVLRLWFQRGKIDRVGHGIYRFRQIPPTPLDAYMLATLWPAGRGVLSHHTALELHELCDINPSRIHITLPTGYRPRRRGGELYAVHHECLREDEVTWHEGMRIVTPSVAIRQALETGVPLHLLRQAMDISRRLGRAPRPVLDELAKRLSEKA
jgi:predicted transcriptional regulator of viral defense system